MAPSSCFVDPMECIFEKPSIQILQKRAPPPPDDAPTTGAVPPVSHTVVIASAVAGTVLLILSISFIYCCMRKRRASRRIGQLQKFLPTFMDQEKTEKYFQKQGSSTTLVATPSLKEKELVPPSNAHHRTRSVPVAFAKGVTDHRNRQLERDGSLGQFQQISLVSEETVLEKDEPELTRSSSGRSTRARSSTTTVASPAAVKSSLHRSVSLNKRSSQRTAGSRSDPMEEEEVDQSERFPEGESLVAPNRFSTLLDFGNGNNRFSAQSIIDMDPNFDPTRFSSASIMFDAKRLSNASISSEDSVSTNSSDEFRKNLPPHQLQPSFHSHVDTPIERSNEVSAEAPAPMAPNLPSYSGDKQELEEDEEYIPQPPNFYNTQVQDHQRQPYPPMHQNRPMAMPTPMHMSMPMPMPVPIPTPAVTPGSQGRTGSPLPPLPPRIMLSKPHVGQEMSMVVDDRGASH
ncbi:hypothetical protein BGZ79_008915 [Entomortierella chlamydospora]|nr:hypothetical protein BGZ79_008915 [Entomortierella chlamydospora]